MSVTNSRAKSPSKSHRKTSPPKTYDEWRTDVIAHRRTELEATRQQQEKEQRIKNRIFRKFVLAVETEAQPKEGVVETSAAPVDAIMRSSPFPNESQRRFLSPSLVHALEMRRDREFAKSTREERILNDKNYKRPSGTTALQPRTLEGIQQEMNRQAEIERKTRRQLTRSLSEGMRSEMNGGVTESQTLTMLLEDPTRSSIARLLQQERARQFRQVEEEATTTPQNNQVEGTTKPPEVENDSAEGAGDPQLEPSDSSKEPQKEETDNSEIRADTAQEAQTEETSPPHEDIEMSITVHGCKGLKDTDSGFNGDSDPYVKILRVVSSNEEPSTSQKLLLRTPTVQDKLNPEWSSDQASTKVAIIKEDQMSTENEKEKNVIMPKDTLLVEVWDEDTFNDEPLGYVSFAVADILAANKVENSSDDANTRRLIGRQTHVLTGSGASTSTSSVTLSITLVTK